MKHIKKIAATLSMLAMPLTASAKSFGDMSTAITTSGLGSIGGLLGSGLTYLGGGIVLFGGIQIAFAFRSDDAEGKTKGLRNAVAGALVAAVGVAASVFLAS